MTDAVRSAGAVSANGNAGADAFADIETAALGVYNRNNFDFALYAEILDHFQIEAQDWVNPGRRFDARLIEMSGG
jgi:hypothetical protein